MNNDSKDDQNLENKLEKMQEWINKVLEELKNKHAETNNTITEIKNTLKKYSRGNHSRISEAAKQIGKLEDKMVDIASEEQNKVKKKLKELRIVSEPSGTISNTLTFKL